MAKTSLIDGIPVFEALVTDEDCGMVRISLVDLPAVMSNWQAFADKQPQRFSIADEDQRLIRGVIMRCDFPIYRRDSSGEYYIIYRAETIRQMAEKYLAENRANRVDLMHDGDEVRGVQMVQWFIKDTEKGLDPAGYEDIADGSLFAEFHITDDAIWEAVKDGTFKGFSLEGFFDVAPDTHQADIDEIVEELEGRFSAAEQPNKQKYMAKIEAMFKRLGELLEASNRSEQKFGAVTTDKGILEWDGDGDLEAGMEVYIVNADGAREAAADGDYTTEDAKVIVVEGGRVSEIRDPKAEVAPEPAAEETEETEEAAAEEVQASAQRFARRKAAFDESYDEKYKKIWDALFAERGEGDWYLQEAGDDFAVIVEWTEEEGEKYIRYEVTWNEDGTANVSNPIEVKPAFVPEDVDTAALVEEAADQSEAERENEELRAKVAELEGEIEKLRKQPMAKTAHEEVKEFNAFRKTGNKSIDRLSQLLSASGK